MTDYERVTEEAKRLIVAVRKNQGKSLCRSVTLHGPMTFRILPSVHPKASVSISMTGVEFLGAEGGFYARPLPLKDPFLELDLSRLRRVRASFSGASINPRWKELLSGLSLESAEFGNIQQAAELYVNVDQLRVHFPLLWTVGHSPNWDWLSTVRQVVLPVPTVFDELSRLRSHFERMGEILDNFCGTAVWIEGYHRFDCTELPNSTERPSHVVAGQRLLRSIDRFEERGGDAESMRGFVMACIGFWLDFFKRRGNQRDMNDHVCKK